MKELEKAEKLNELFSLYRKLFTDKQKEYFMMYYELDYSLQEIAENFDISRNAVFDQLKKVEENLLSYEEKLNLLKNKKKRLKLIKTYIETKNEKLLSDLKGMDE